ncbi:disaggregatase related repeat-containing protein [uncultured Methanomethylovorans sp.]|uniref:disaggregatase related repeat-containing protein n=1 Tax=uncultured Methanomethylovorans sp. TaxID=183759 RepID=UPI0037488D9E
MISLFLFFLVIGTGLSAAVTVYVDTDGSGNYNCDGTNDHVEINNALTYIDGLGGGTVYLRGPNTYWIDSTLNIGANTILTGDPTAEIKLVASAGWSSGVPMIANIGTDDDITITGFTIDGNSANQGVTLGAGYYNMMYFDYADNIEVSHMRLEWGCGDGLKISSGNNIEFIYNDVYKLGHDALYALGCSNVEHAHNTIMTRTNSGCRLSYGCSDAVVHDNLFYSSLTSDSTGPAIELDSTATTVRTFNNIDIYNNRIHTLNGAGIWMFANYLNDNDYYAENVHIHHNIFTNVGQYYNTSTNGVNYGYTHAAIVMQNFNNTVIENNVIDNGGLAGIKYFIPTVAGTKMRQQKLTFTTIVRNNVIMNSDHITNVPQSGAGIWNDNTTYARFIVQNNDFWNNENGQTYPSSSSSFTMSNNIAVSPLFYNAGTNVAASNRDYHLLSQAGRWTGSIWAFDQNSSPLIDAGYSGSTYSAEPSPNGGRINIGRYGNTNQASKSGTTNNPPVANAGADKTATTGSTVSFDGSASTDDNGIASYSWDFDASNGITSEATGVTATKTYTTAGTYTVTLTVTDTGGQSDTDTLQVVVSNPTLNTAYDNRLRESSPTTVLSNYTYIDVGKYGTSRFRDTLWFNLSEYNTTISSATLSLYWYYPVGATRANDTVVEVYRPVAWDPSYVCWNYGTSGTLWSSAGGDWYDKNGVSQGSTPYASLTFPASTVPDNKYYEFDVTDLVQEYISGNYTNTGFFIKARSENGNYIAFYSLDWSNSSQRPKLTINTTVDNPPVANAGADKAATTGSVVSFNGSASTDDNGIASYSWDFDVSNGITSEATGVTATKTYTTAGTYTVTLTVTDTVGQTDTDTLQVVVSTSANTVTLTPIYDNRLRDSSPTTVLSDSTYIDVGKYTTTRYRDALMFNLSGYNTTDTVTDATLSLYWYYPVGATRANDTVVEVYRPVTWDPSYVCWNNRASGIAWNTAGGDWYDKNGVSQGTTPYDSVTFSANTVPDNRYYEFDVTDLVQEYVSGTYTNTGFFLKANTESNNYIAFYSSDWSNTTQKPKLTVTVTPGSADESPVANAGSDKTATTGTVVSFNGSASTDDNGIASYSWDFDASNGITSEATGVTATKTYTTAGNYTVTLTVTDTIGQTDTDTLQVVVTSPTTTISYTPTSDNRLRDSSPTTVLSTTTFIDVGKYSTTRYRDVLMFNLSGYNTTDTITDATLSLYWYYPVGATRANDTVVEVYRPVAWDPNYVCWNNRASGTAWNTAGGDWYDKNGVSQGTTPYDSVTFSANTVPDNRYYEFDVTDLVQAYVSGTYTNTGFFLKANTESNNYIAFYSSDWSNATQKPKLTVTGHS